MYQRASRLAAHELDEVNTRINEWIKDGIIRHSVSESSCFGGEKDGSKRLCVDYRLLNKKIVKDRCPLPLIEDQLDKLQDAKVFSTVDLKKRGFPCAGSQVEQEMYCVYCS